jgi:hypothetical protein
MISYDNVQKLGHATESEKQSNSNWLNSDVFNAVLYNWKKIYLKTLVKTVESKVGSAWLVNLFEKKRNKSAKIHSGIEPYLYSRLAQR